jgi:signal transduction histidine kinase
VFASRPAIAGLGTGVAAALAASLLPGGPGWTRAVLAAALPAAGWLAGALVAMRRHAREDLAVLLSLREELRLCQDHIMAGETFRSLGAYLEIAAHQIREPLNALLTGLEGLAADGVPPDGGRDQVRALRARGETLRAALRHLASYALNKPGRAPFSVNTLLREAILLLRYRAQEKGIRIEERYALIPPVMGSAARVHLALLNIVINAIEAMPYDGGRITVETAHENDRVVARVRDTGIGIRPHELPHIFEPFFTTKPERQGVGLGLWAARQSLDIIGADIVVKSTPLQGTEVTVSFPAAAPLRPGREGAATPPELPVNTAFEDGRHIA